MHAPYTVERLGRLRDEDDNSVSYVNVDHGYTNHVKDEQCVVDADEKENRKIFERIMNTQSVSRPSQCDPGINRCTKTSSMNKQKVLQEAFIQGRAHNSACPDCNIVQLPSEIFPNKQKQNRTKNSGLTTEYTRLPKTCGNALAEIDLSTRYFSPGSYQPTNVHNLEFVNQYTRMEA